MAARGCLSTARARAGTLLAVAALALGACGGDDGGDEGGGETKKLTPAQFEALERVNTLESCTGLDREDPLLGPIRRACQAATKVESEFVRAVGCTGGADCKRAFDTVGRAARRARATGRAMDRTVAGTDLAPECKNALKTPRSIYGTLDKLESALREATPRVATGTPEDALVELAEIGKLRNELPDRDDLLARLRAGCR